MSDEKKPQSIPGAELRSNRMHNVGMPVEKSENFSLSARRLLGLMAGEKVLVGFILVLALASVGLVVSGPRILGHATNILYEGIRARIESPESGGIDFGALHTTLIVALVVYALSFLLSYAQTFLLAGVVQRTMYTLRQDVEA